MIHLLIWLLNLAEVYGIGVAIWFLAYRLQGIKSEPAWFAASRLYGLRPKKGIPFLQEHTRVQRVAELDEHDLALIEANKEVANLLGEGKKD